jgi:hypothetical protein
MNCGTSLGKAYLKKTQPGNRRFLMNRTMARPRTLPTADEVRNGGTYFNTSQPALKSKSAPIEIPNQGNSLILIDLLEWFEI